MPATNDRDLAGISVLGLMRLDQSHFEGITLRICAIRTLPSRTVPSCLHTSYLISGVFFCLIVAPRVEMRLR